MQRVLLNVEIFTVLSCQEIVKGTTSMTSCKKLEIIQVFSIVDATLVKKSTTNMTSCNGHNKKVRQQR